MCILYPAWSARNGVEFNCGIFKMTNLPPEGEMITPLHYKGFLFRKVITFCPEWGVTWNLPTGEEIKQRIVIWSSRISRFLASLWVNMRGLR